MKNALELLQKPAPGMREKRQALAEINSQVAVNRSQLGLPAAMFEFNPNKAVAALLETQQQLAAKGLAPAPAAVSPAPAGRPVESSGSGTLDRAISASGTHNLRTFNLKAKRDQLAASVAHQPAGSIARKCAESNLQNAEAELRNS